MVRRLKATAGMASSFTVNNSWLCREINKKVRLRSAAAAPWLRARSGKGFDKAGLCFADVVTLLSRALIGPFWKIYSHIDDKYYMCVIIGCILYRIIYIWLHTNLIEVPSNFNCMVFNCTENNFSCLCTIKLYGWIKYDAKWIRYDFSQMINCCLPLKNN